MDEQQARDFWPGKDYDDTEEGMARFFGLAPDEPADDDAAAALVAAPATPGMPGFGQAPIENQGGDPNTMARQFFGI